MARARLTELIRPHHSPPSPVGPDSVHVQARRIDLGQACAASFAVVGYPREVGPGWLEPLLTHGGTIDVALYVEPVPAQVAADRLRRQLARLESDRRAAAGKGMLIDPEIEVAAEDASDLGNQIARGEGKLFRVGLYVTVHASGTEALVGECARLRALSSSLLLDAVPTTWRQLQGWATTLPVGIDRLSMRRSFDTQALSYSYPFASSRFSRPEGILYGRAAKGAGLVFWDRFAQDNYNEVVLAASGAGKSYFAKLGILRSLYRGVEVFVVDPEDEYRRLAESVGGTYIALGDRGVKVNPFDLGTGDDPLIARALFIHSLIAMILGAPLGSGEKAVLDRAILAAYNHAGITADPATHHRPAPLLADLAGALSADPDARGAGLAERLSPYVAGSHRGLFDGQTSTTPKGHLVVFSLRRLPEELKGAGTLIILDAITRQVSDASSLRPRQIVVDEAYLLMREPDGARFLFRLAKGARKYWCGLTTITQDADDLLSTPLGHAVVSNAASQILLRQAPQAIDALSQSFRLSAGERAYLLAARRGDALLIAGTERVAFRPVASPAEHALITTDPSELAEMAEPSATGEPNLRHNRES